MMRKAVGIVIICCFGALSGAGFFVFYSVLDKVPIENIEPSCPHSDDQLNQGLIRAIQLDLDHHPNPYSLEKIVIDNCNIQNILNIISAIGYNTLRNEIRKYTSNTWNTNIYKILFKALAILRFNMKNCYMNDGRLHIDMSFETISNRYIQRYVNCRVLLATKDKPDRIAFYIDQAMIGDFDLPEIVLEKVSHVLLNTIRQNGIYQRLDNTIKTIDIKNGHVTILYYPYRVNKIFDEYNIGI